MGMFSPDFASVEAGITIYEGRARVKVTGKVPFAGETRDDKTGNVTENAGVRYKLELIGMFDDKGQLVTDDFQGKTVTPFKAWVHGEGGWKYSKPFLMAANGYTIKEENEANLALFMGKQADWLFNGDKDTPPDNFEVGPGYDTPVGKILDVTLRNKKQPAKDGSDRIYENQEYGSWTPVK
jgi:hypothetical protein